MTYLTLGTLWKNENDIAKNFVTYHKAVGIQKFVILDREFNEINEMFKDDPDVEVRHWPDTPQHIHSTAWAELIGYCRGKTKWLFCVDADQAITPVKTNDVKEILKDYEDFASLQCNWHTFGSSGLLHKTPEPLYEKFLMRAKPLEGVNNHTQFCCQPSRTLAQKTHDPHHPILPPHEISVNTNKQRVDGPYNMPPLHDVLWIAHYINKSKEEYMIKHSKNRADIFNEKMPIELFDIHEQFCNAEKEERVLELWNRCLTLKQEKNT